MTKQKPPPRPASHVTGDDGKGYTIEYLEDGRQRAGELPSMPHNNHGEPFSGPRLIIARMRRGLSLDELATQLHIDRQTLIGFESETVAPALNQIVLMSTVLHFPLKFFFAIGERLINPEEISWRDGPWLWDIDNLHTRKWMGGSHE